MYGEIGAWSGCLWPYQYQSKRTQNRNIEIEAFRNTRTYVSIGTGAVRHAIMGAIWLTGMNDEAATVTAPPSSNDTAYFTAGKHPHTGCPLGTDAAWYTVVSS